RKISVEPCILFLVRYNRKRTLWRELDVTRQALRGAKTPAPPPQDCKSQAEIIRSRKAKARQTSCARQEVFEPQNPRRETRGIAPAIPAARSAALLDSCYPKKRGVNSTPLLPSMMV